MPLFPSEGEPVPYSRAWHVEHERRHVAAYPDVDNVTRDNLRAAIVRAS
jgi:hypothetical protein